MNMRLTTLLITIILSIVTVSMAQEEDPLGLSSSTVLKRIYSQYGQYFADKIVELRGVKGQSQPREWKIVVHDERSQRRLRTVIISGDRIRDEGETLNYYPDNLPIGFASSAKINLYFSIILAANSICFSGVFSNPALSYTYKCFSSFH